MIRREQLCCQAGLGRYAPWLLLAIAIDLAVPTVAQASDFSGLAVAGLFILGVILVMAFALSAITAVILNSKVKRRVNWWWFTPLFTAIWGYLLFQITYFLR